MLKSIPWFSIIKSSFIAVLGWACLSYLLLFISQTVPPIQGFLSLFLMQPVNLLTSLGVGFLIGAFALFLFERFEKYLTVTQLWFLVLASAIGMFFYEWFPIRIYRLLGISFSQAMLIGIILGIFISGKKHWR